MKIMYPEDAIKWHLENNIQPKLQPKVIKKVLESIKSFNEGYLLLNDIIIGDENHGITFNELCEDLKIELIN